MPAGHDRDELNALALEAVLGTLRGEALRSTEARYRHHPAWADAHRFWEEQLMALQQIQASPPPDADSWAKILARINRPTEYASPPFWHQLLHWRWYASVTLALLLILVVLLPTQPPLPAPGFHTDYVAVLTSPEQDALLTVLASGDARQAQLHWAIAAPEAEYSLQLWAVSRRDGMTRSLAVFESGQLEREQLALSDADWRLIQDAHRLLLTKEEAGGSALDQPSERILAQGICVRLEET